MNTTDATRRRARTERKLRADFLCVAKNLRRSESGQLDTPTTAERVGRSDRAWYHVSPAASSGDVYWTRYRFPEPCGHPGLQPSPKHIRGGQWWVHSIQIGMSEVERRRAPPRTPRPCVPPVSHRRLPQPRRALTRTAIGDADAAVRCGTSHAAVPDGAERIDGGDHERARA